MTQTNDYAAGNVSNLPKGFEKGQVFTPAFLAKWVAEVLKEHLGGLWSGKLLDPACGDGELLAASAEMLPDASLFGVDIDAKAAVAARRRLGGSATIKTADMLVSPLAGKNEKPLTFEALISNPPWGADLLHSRPTLKNLGYSLAHGQFDTWSLFVEASLRILEDQGVAAFILPDAIFASEHTSTRTFLAENFSIKLIARLGEGIFQGICRGTAVIVIRKQKPSPDHPVEVFRLAKPERAAVISGNLALNAARMGSRHFVSQNRFVSNSLCRWDIDVRSSDRRVLEKMESRSGNWSELIHSGRGVELSKKGIVKTCRGCGRATPMPAQPRVITCVACGASAHSDEMPTQRIVVNEPNSIPGFMPLVVGEDIRRYGLSCSRQIKLDVPGINYKNPELYTRERLLVRKTGIGIKATVTKMLAASNQVVFHYVPRAKEMGFCLYYILGVLASRTMFAYHLRKSGESEWRSHPYVTPTQLAALPIPAPLAETPAWRQAVEIADRVRKHLRGGGRSQKLDLEIEGLVAGIYGLDHSDLDWVKSVIRDAQDLEPMRDLGRFDAASIPIEVMP